VKGGDFMSKKQEGGEKKKTGPKEKYFTHIQPYLEAIAAMRRNGIAQEQIAEKFGISVDTLGRYKQKYSEFADVLKENAEVADMAVENALFQSAIGGNLGAQVFWLKNRASRKWRDKQHVFQQSTTTVRKDYENMTDEELEKEEAMLEDILPGDEFNDMESDGEIH
jgi:transcriptional regulator with XRE-family HTH domain